MPFPAAEPTFRSAVLPLATALHVLEEWPGFPCWARRFASPAYGDRDYVVTHAFAIAGSAAVAVLLWAFPRAGVVHAFFLLWLAPSVFGNALFHAGASVVSRTYCPGTLTGLVLYLPLSLALARLALDEGLVGAPALAVLVVVGLALHAVEVGHDVLKRW